MQNENVFKRLAVTVSPDVIDRCKKDITSKSDDPVNNCGNIIGFSVDESLKEETT